MWFFLAMSCLGPVSFAPSAHVADPDTPRQPRLDARGVFEGERPRAPMAPEGCTTLVHIVAPYAVCEEPGLEAHVDEVLLDRWSEGPGRLVNTMTPYDGAALDGPPSLQRCGLVCDRAQERANWNLSFSEGGWSGTATCALGEVARLEVELEEAGAPVPDGVGVMWLTDLSGFRLGGSLGDRPGRASGPTWLLGDNLCPAGQPTREGGVTGALDPPQEQ